MTVICGRTYCPYFDKNSPYEKGWGYCGRGVVKINVNGLCAGVDEVHHWNGRKIYKNRTVFIDTEEMPETIEENRKEDAGSRPEDLIDGPAAYEQVAEKKIL